MEFQTTNSAKHCQKMLDEIAQENEVEREFMVLDLRIKTDKGTEAELKHHTVL